MPLNQVKYEYKKRKHYPDEFKKEAVRLALESGKPKTQVARTLGISDGLLHNWINKQNEADSKGLSPLCVFW